MYSKEGHLTRNTLVSPSSYRFPIFSIPPVQALQSRNYHLSPFMNERGLLIIPLFSCLTTTLLVYLFIDFVLFLTRRLYSNFYSLAASSQNIHFKYKFYSIFDSFLELNYFLNEIEYTYQLCFGLVLDDNLLKTNFNEINYLGIKTITSLTRTHPPINLHHNDLNHQSMKCILQR